MPSAKSNNLTGCFICINLIFFPCLFCSSSVLRKIIKWDMDSGHPCWVLYFSEMASGFFYLGRFRLWALGFPGLQFSNLAYWKKNCFSCYIFPALPQFFELFKKAHLFLSVCFSSLCLIKWCDFSHWAENLLGIHLLTNTLNYFSLIKPGATDKSEVSIGDDLTVLQIPSSW